MVTCNDNIRFKKTDDFLCCFYTNSHTPSLIQETLRVNSTDVHWTDSYILLGILEEGVYVYVFVWETIQSFTRFPKTYDAKK